MTAPSSAPADTPFRWTAQRFFRGLGDWLRARAKHGDAADPSAPKKPSVIGTALIALALVALVGAVVVTLVPPLASLLGAAGTPFLLVLSGALVVAGGVLLFGALPYYACTRGYRFAQNMAYRGWELETGRRVPI